MMDSFASGSDISLNTTHHFPALCYVHYDILYTLKIVL